MTNKHMTKEQLLELSDDQRRALTNAEFFATTEGLELTIDNDNDKRIAAEADRRGLIGEMIYYLVRRQWWDMCDPENLENARKEILEMLDGAIAQVQQERTPAS
jgi:hypothetical protein